MLSCHFFLLVSFGFGHRSENDAAAMELYL